MATNNAVNVGLSGSTGTGSFVGSASPTFTGTPVIPTPFTLGATSVTSTGTNLNLLSGATATCVKRANTETGAVATGTTTVPADDTIPQITEGDQYMTLAYTPLNSANILKITVVAQVSNSLAQTIVGALFQDSTANALACSMGTITPNTAVTPLVFIHTMTAGTTSSTTFRFRAGPVTNGTFTFNGSVGSRLFGGVLASGIYIEEFTS